MTGADQFYVALVCAACGAASGLAYDFFYLIRRFFPSRATDVICDVSFFLAFSAVYLYVSLLFGLPDLRVYMFLSCLVGLILYLKSWHGLVAFFSEKIYNKVVKRGRASALQPNMEKKRCRTSRKRQKELS